VNDQGAYAIIIPCGCDKEELPEGYSTEYFYYTFGFEKVFLYLKRSELFISFHNDSISLGEAENILNEYQNDSIDYATPVFAGHPKDEEGYIILTDGIVCDPDISSVEFENLILELYD